MPQPKPKPGVRTVYAKAMSDFKRTAQKQYDAGLEEYGTPLMTFNGRDVYRDGLEELFDAAMYLTQAKLEREYIVSAMKQALVFLKLHLYVNAHEALVDVLEKVS